MLGHRVVTLHPAVHGGILARRDVPEDLADLAAARDRAVRPRRRQPLPVHRGRGAGTACRGGGGRDDRHRRPGAAARGGEELRATSRRSPGRSGTRACSTSCASTASCRSTRAGRSPAETFVVTAAYESAIAAWFGDREAFPEGLIPTFWKERNLAYGENPHQRAAYYAEAGARRHLLSRVEQLAREGALLQQPQRPLGRAPARRGVHAPGLRDRQAREPVRGRGRRTRSRTRTRRRSASDPVSAYGGVVVLNRPVSAELARADRGAVRRGAVRAGVRRGRARRRCARRRRSGSSTRPSGAQRAGRRARLPPRARRPARPGPRRRRRGPRRDDRRLRRAGRGGLGRPALRLARLQARHLERDRDRQGPAHDRDRRRPDEPRRRGADRGREGARARPRPRRAPSSPRTPSSRSPTGRRSRSNAGVPAIIQPGGSKRDADVVAAVEAAGATMVFTGRRHFRH